MKDRLTVVAENEVLTRLKEIAEEEDRSVSYIVNKALKEFVARKEMPPAKEHRA